jgi:hypothetical protein
MKEYNKQFILILLDFLQITFNFYWVFYKSSLKHILLITRFRNVCVKWYESRTKVQDSHLLYFVLNNDNNSLKIWIRLTWWGVLKNLIDMFQQQFYKHRLYTDSAVI